MDRGYGWRRSSGFSPLMMVLGIVLVIFIFSKVWWLLPMLFFFGWMASKGSWHHWSEWCESDEHDKRKNEAYAKRKNDERYDEYKRKNDEDVYYV
jgi:hypothetical protein